MRKFIIRSVRRDLPNNYFCAIHSFTPYYATKAEARTFETEREASDYALKELFTVESAFDIEIL